MPTPLFKYFGHPETSPLENSALKVLDKLSLKVTPPNEFNDPFEFSPVVKTSDPNAAGRERLNRILSDPSFYIRNRPAFSACKDFADFQAFVRSRRDFFEKDLAKRLTNLDEEFQNDILPFLGSHYGVICFSAVDCEPLMWAHYATSHSGVMLEFAQDCPLFQGGAFLEVDYNQDRAIYDPSQPADGSQVIALARRKSEHWGYEKEYRVVVKLADTRNIASSGAKPLYLLQIEAKWLASVTFGCKCPKALRDEVLKLLTRTELRHIQPCKIQMDRALFKFLRTRL